MGEGDWPKQVDDHYYASEVNGDMMPVGTIMAFMKSTVGAKLPPNWVECDGSVLSDSDSVYDGVTLPNLNGTTDETKKFLRGNTSSGGEGGSSSGSTSHNHPTTKTTDNAYTRRSGATCTSRSADQSASSVTGNANASAGAVIPPCIEMVWILRIK